MALQVYLISGVMLGVEVTEDVETGGPAVVVDLLVVRLVFFW